MQNRKIVLSGVVVIIVILVSLVFIFKNKNESNLNEEINEEQIKCTSEGGLWQEDKFDEWDDDELCGICVFEDKKAENVKLIDKKDKERFGYNFYKIDDEIFVSSRKLEKFDLDTFTVLGNTAFAKDKNNVYVDGDILIGADVETFVVGEYTYNYAQLAMDKK